MSLSEKEPGTQSETTESHTHRGRPCEVTAGGQAAPAGPRQPPCPHPARGSQPLNREGVSLWLEPAARGGSDSSGTLLSCFALTSPCGLCVKAQGGRRSVPVSCPVGEPRPSSRAHRGGARSPAHAGHLAQSWARCRQGPWKGLHTGLRAAGARQPLVSPCLCFFPRWLGFQSWGEARGAQWRGSSPTPLKMQVWARPGVAQARDCRLNLKLSHMAQRFHLREMKTRCPHKIRTAMLRAAPSGAAERWKHPGHLLEKKKCAPSTCEKQQERFYASAAGGEKINVVLSSARSRATQPGVSSTAAQGGEGGGRCLCPRVTEEPENRVQGSCHGASGLNSLVPGARLTRSRRAQRLATYLGQDHALADGLDWEGLVEVRGGGLEHERG